MIEFSIEGGNFRSKTDLEFLLGVASLCGDASIAAINYSGRGGKYEWLYKKIHLYVYMTGLARVAEGRFTVPLFINRFYREFRNSFLEVLDSVKGNVDSFIEWQNSQDVISVVRRKMHYDEVLQLDARVKEFLYAKERANVLLYESHYICDVDAYTSGHHRDMMELLSYAIKGTSVDKLGDCWVYMNEDKVINFTELMHSISCFKVPRFSGAASAVATKLAIQENSDVEVIYQDTGSEHLTI